MRCEQTSSEACDVIGINADECFSYHCTMNKSMYVFWLCGFLCFSFASYLSSVLKVQQYITFLVTEFR